MTALNGSTQIQAGSIPLSKLASGYSIPLANIAGGTSLLNAGGTVAMTSSFNFGSQTGINLASPVNATDAANKAYVDQKSGGIGGVHEVNWYQATNVAALTGLAAVTDGTAVAGDVVVLGGQTTQSQNGPWVVASGAWTRPTWWASASSVPGGQYFLIQEGTTYKETKWWCAVMTAITVDTTAITFVQDNGTVYTQGTGITISAGQISVNYGTTATTAAAGNDSRITGALQTSSLGTNVATALGVAVGSAGSVVVNGGALGTPSSGSLANATGLPIAGVTGWGTSVASALAIAVGTAGSFVVNGGAAGTPSSITLTNGTGLPIGGISGLGSGNAAALAIAAGTGSGFALLSSGLLTAAEFPALTGDVTTTAGSLTTTVNNASGTGFTKYTNHVNGEVPTGTVNGSNTTFTLTHTPASVFGGASSLRLMLNGDRIFPTTDYTISGATITMLTAPSGSDALAADYMI